MFPKISSPSKALSEFILALHLSLSKPQMRHAVDVVDSLIVCESTKTLSVLNQQLLKPKDIYALADFFTYSPWNPDQLRLQIGYYLIKWALEHSYKDSPVFISIDDSMTKKPKESRHFEPVDWHHDHLGGGSSYSYGLGFITCRIQIGNCSFTVNHRLYMREKTVRRLNRSRPKEKRLKFRTKYSLAQTMLFDLLSLIPKEHKVYVLFDSWYSSAKLIKFCLRHKWQVICALKHNRLLDGKGLSSHAKYLRNKSFIPVRVSSAESVTEYLTYSLKGHLNGIADGVCVIISKRHSRDRRPEYFLSTDLSLSTEKILNWYTKRWSCEVDYLYLKGRLGLEDFRLRSVEGITKYFSLVFLALVYLQFRLVKERGPKIKTLADVISFHREEHFENLLKEVCQLTLQKDLSEVVLQRFFLKVT